MLTYLEALLDAGSKEGALHRKQVLVDREAVTLAFDSEVMRVELAEVFNAF